MESFNYPIKLAGIDFQGPYPLEIPFKNLPGVYIIHDRNIFLDIGETDKLEEGIKNHWKFPYWVNYTSGIMVSLSFHYCSSAIERKKIKDKLVEVYDPCFEPLAISVSATTHQPLLIDTLLKT
ncbi:hypothetical protein GF360_02905 [candidate division WWE3 bacterium]|nr:hypothetical protein [candidate division WWE3 bacterium]